jgi:AraC-like DNA-binding protein
MFAGFRANAPVGWTGEVPLRLLAASRGSSIVRWRGRTVRLDPDACLLLDSRQSYQVANESDSGALTMAMVLPCDDLSDIPRSATEKCPLTDHLIPLQSHAARSSPVRSGEGAEALGAPAPQTFVAAAGSILERTTRLGCVKRTTRDALLERVLTASDYIADHYQNPTLSLGDVARAASLSRFHFVRLFAFLLGVTPHAYLVGKRTRVALRCLEAGRPSNEAATLAGFGSRSTMSRNLRRHGPASTTCCHSV